MMQVILFYGKFIDPHFFSLYIFSPRHDTEGMVVRNGNGTKGVVYVENGVQKAETDIGDDDLQRTPVKESKVVVPKLKIKLAGISKAVERKKPGRVTRASAASQTRKSKGKAKSKATDARASEVVTRSRKAKKTEPLGDDPPYPVPDFQMVECPSMDTPVQQTVQHPPQCGYVQPDPNSLAGQVDSFFSTFQVNSFQEFMQKMKDGQVDVAAMIKGQERQTEVKTEEGIGEILTKEEAEESDEFVKSFGTDGTLTAEEVGELLSTRNTDDEVFDLTTENVTGNEGVESESLR